MKNANKNQFYENIREVKITGNMITSAREYKVNRDLEKSELGE